jgi:hypothetical protein
MKDGVDIASAVDAADKLNSTVYRPIEHKREQLITGMVCP